MAPGPELPHARWGRGAGLPQACGPVKILCSTEMLTGTSDIQGGQHVSLLFFSFPIGLRCLLLAGRILFSSHQMPPPAVTQPGCYSASLLLAAAFCFLDFSLFGGFGFFWFFFFF